jgi:hypothetical protein
MTAYEFYAACYKAARKSLLITRDVQSAIQAANSVVSGGALKMGAQWRLQAQAIKDAVEDEGGFAAETGSRQSRDLNGPIFDGHDIRDFRPADRDLVESSRQWATKTNRMDSVLVSVHRDQCSYFMLAV